MFGTLSQSSRHDPPSNPPAYSDLCASPHHPVGPSGVSQELKGFRLHHPVSTRVCWPMLHTIAPQNLTAALHLQPLQLLKSGFNVLCRTGLSTPSSGPTIASFIWMPLPDPLTFKGHLKLMFMGCVVSMGTLKNICWPNRTLFFKFLVQNSRFC